MLLVSTTSTYSNDEILTITSIVCHLNFNNIIVCNNNMLLKLPVNLNIYYVMFDAFQTIKFVGYDNFHNN